MAKKITVESLKKRLEDLKEVEQTAEVMAEIDEINEKISEMESQQAPKAKASGPYTIYEEWRMERKGKELIKLKLVKEVLLLPEQAEELNSQKFNSLIEYIEK